MFRVGVVPGGCFWFWPRRPKNLKLSLSLAEKALVTVFWAVLEDAGGAFTGAKKRKLGFSVVGTPFMMFGWGKLES